ncbi:MAG: globin domain-containing protein [Bacteroidetes bacterium]|nr:globin domain-containing protein [Bacteroidota bacterium]
MTQRHIALVRSSFAKMLPTTDTTAALFYARLFAIAPYVRPLFKNDVNVQGQQFMHTLRVIVDRLDTLDENGPVFGILRRKLHSCGITNAHYDIIASAFLWTLERELGADFTEEVRSAWVAMYVSITDVMKRAEKEVHTTA